MATWSILIPFAGNLSRAEPYPVEALGEILGEAAKVKHSIIKAPLAICAQSVLAAANLVVQGHADVVIDGRRFPVSEYFLSIAQSGERKSAADAAALAPVDAHQRYLLEAYNRDSSQYGIEAALWKKEYEEALRNKNPQTRRALLESLNPAPTRPPYPQLTTEEPTYEGLVKLLALGWPTVGRFSSEGGRFFGGFAMNLENRLKTLAGLSDLWDGRPLTRTRAGDGSVTLYGRRCCAHLLMQPLVAENILGDPLAHDQGFLSRCLIIAPESALGNQTYEAQDLNQQAAYGHYCARITAILQAQLPFKPDPETGKLTNELITKSLQISQDAKQDLIDFHDWVQENLRPDGAYLPISGIAAKAAEHALRLAGTLTLVESLEGTVISQENVRSGIILANFYLTEALRLFHSAKANLDLINAEKVLAWLRTRTGAEKSLICLPDVYRLGPNVVRDKETAAKIMGILADHGWVNQLANGAKIDGKQRRLYNNGNIVRGDIEHIYEGLFIDAITSFEGLIEKLFIGLLTGNIRHVSNRVIPRVHFKSSKVAREIVFGGRNYVDWLPYGHTEQRANAFFRNGYPFTFMEQPEKNTLSKLWCIRNAIAHISRFSLQKFQRNVIGALPLLPRKRTPAGFLRSQFRVRPIQTQYEVSIIDICNLASKIC